MPTKLTWVRVPVMVGSTSCGAGVTSTVVDCVATRSTIVSVSGTLVRTTTGARWGSKPEISARNS